MNHNPAFHWVRSARNIVVTLCLPILCGCFGGYQLVTFGPESYVTGWHQYVSPRPPASPIEDLVVQVARTHQDRETADADILFIINDTTKGKSVQVVDVAGKTESKQQFPERTVTRYRIVDGMIVAMSDPSDEFYVNAALERAILRSIAKTWSSDRVLVYNDGSSSMSIVSHAVNKCTADVKIYAAGKTGGPPTAEKRVAFCFEN